MVASFRIGDRGLGTLSIGGQSKSTRQAAITSASQIESNGELNRQVLKQTDSILELSNRDEESLHAARKINREQREAAHNLKAALQGVSDAAEESPNRINGARKRLADIESRRLATSRDIRNENSSLASERKSLSALSGSDKIELSAPEFSDTSSPKNAHSLRSVGEIDAYIKSLESEDSSLSHGLENIRNVRGKVSERLRRVV